MTRFDAGIGGLGAALFVALVLCYSKARDLAFSTHERWRARKETSKTQLQDLTLRAMFTLQAELNQVLGDQAGGDELLFTVDPTRFRPQILSAAHFYELRQTIDTFYSRARRCALMVPRCLEAAIVSLILFFMRVSWRRAWAGWTLPLAVSMLAISSGALCLIYLGYLHFEGRLKRAVVEADEGVA